MGNELIERDLEVSDHRQLGVGEVREHDARLHLETRNALCLLGKPRVALLQLPRLVDDSIDTLEQCLLI